MGPPIYATRMEGVYHHRAITAEKALSKVLSENGLDEYKARCDAEVRSKTAQLENSKERVASLQKKIHEIEETICTLKTENKELQKSCKEKDTQIASLTREKEDLKADLEAERKKYSEKAEECEKISKELQDAKDKLGREEVIRGHDHTNSSMNSGQDPNHGKLINNSREPTDRKPGAQPGHEHHGRKRLPTTEPDIIIQPPPEVLQNPDRFIPCRSIRKQLVDMNISYMAVDYVATEYYDTVLHKYVTGEFPPLIKDDVNYGPVVRTTALLLYHRCKGSLQKVSEMIGNLTDHAIEPSTGWINGLTKEFNILTEEDRNKWFKFLEKDAKVINVDATSVRVNGKLHNVYTCVSGSYVLYIFREHKGHEGIKGTPVEHTHAVLVHDHAVELFSYGGDHQECLAHVLRYLKDSIMNEPNMEWNNKMLIFIQSLIHEAKQEDGNFSEERIAEIEKEWSEILEGGKEEYNRAGGPKKYYREGFNLLTRLDEYKNEHLLFIRDKTIPYTNNIAEAMLREIKRRVHAVTSFRASENLIDYCEFNSYIMTTINLNKNPFLEMQKLYGDSFADSIDGKTNAEYAAWMQEKKREKRRLAENERLRREQEAKLKVFEEHKRPINKALNRTSKDVRNAEEKSKDVKVALGQINMIVEEVRKCLYNSHRKHNLLEDMQKTLACAGESLEAVRKCAESIDEQLKLSRAAKEVLEKDVKESEADIKEKKKAEKIAKEKRDKQIEWEKVHRRNSTGKESEESIADRTELDFELCIARKQTENAEARKKAVQEKVEASIKDILTLEKRSSRAHDALATAEAALSSAKELVSEFIPDSSKGSAA